MTPEQSNQLFGESGQSSKDGTAEFKTSAAQGDMPARVSGYSANGVADIERIECEPRELACPPPGETQFSAVRRMMNTLDRFISKRFFSIVAFYFFTITLCGVGVLTINTPGSKAAVGNGGGGGKINAANAWLFSVIGLVTFLFLLALVYLISRKRRDRRQ